MSNNNNSRKRLTWEQTAINLAHKIASYRSEDPFCQVGACIIKNDNSIVLGYNGAPSKMEMDWSDRDGRRKWVFHAESNVLNRVLPGETRLLAVTHMPCEQCLKIIKQKEINTVYYSISIPHYTPEQVCEMAKLFNIQLIQIQFNEIAE
jgi:dCMP deaminase